MNPPAGTERRVGPSLSVDLNHPARDDATSGRAGGQGTKWGFGPRRSHPSSRPARTEANTSVRTRTEQEVLMKRVLRSLSLATMLSGMLAQASPASAAF